MYNRETVSPLDLWVQQEEVGGPIESDFLLLSRLQLCGTESKNYLQADSDGWRIFQTLSHLYDTFAVHWDTQGRHQAGCVPWWFVQYKVREGLLNKTLN